MSWRAIWACSGAAAVVSTVALAAFAYPHLDGPLPAHIDFRGEAGGQAGATPLFVFTGIALLDGSMLAALYANDRASKHYTSSFWFFIAVAMWWLAGVQAGFVAAGLRVRDFPWVAMNASFATLFALGVVLVLRSAKHSQGGDSAID